MQTAYLHPRLERLEGVEARVGAGTERAPTGKIARHCLTGLKGCISITNSESRRVEGVRVYGISDGRGQMSKHSLRCVSMMTPPAVRWEGVDLQQK